MPAHSFAFTGLSDSQNFKYVLEELATGSPNPKERRRLVRAVRDAIKACAEAEQKRSADEFSGRAWVAVQDRLPAPYEEVRILFYGVPRIARLNHSSEYFQLASFKDAVNGQYIAAFDNVTGWMPIPFAPDAAQPAPSAAPIPAQPVLDERAAFEAAARRITHSDDSSFERDGDDYHDYTQSRHWAFWQARAALSPAQAAAPDAQPDDAAVDRFAQAMKAKMAASREKGRSGWDDPAQCDVEYLADLLCQHLQKGDPVDVGNFAMMLHQRGADRRLLSEAFAQWRDTPELAAAQPEAKAAPAKEPTLPTDLSHRLRVTADQQPGWKPLLTAAADEIERYYGGMMAWKKTAEKKDADWNAERMGRVDDRIAASKAAPALATLSEFAELDRAAFDAGVEIRSVYEGRWLNTHQIADGVTLEAVNRFITMSSPATICRLIVERDAALAAAGNSRDAKDAARERVRDAVASALVGNFYCGRVWSAWGVGAMREDDFTPSEEVDDVLDEIVDAAIAAMAAPSPAEGV